MAIDTKEVQKQLTFCSELMARLNADVRKDIDKSDYYGVKKHTRKRSDIVRLRRELQRLAELLYPY